MPALSNPRHEAFAHARARGASAAAAYREAFGVASSNTSRLSRDENVQARLEELKAERALMERVELTAVTRSLLQIADTAGAMTSAAGLAVARAALMDVARLNGAAPARNPEAAPAVVTAFPEELSEEEWLRLYAPIR